MKAKLIISFLFVVLLSGCSGWIFRIDVAQGNYIDQDDVDQLRIGMTKEQVVYVLGAPVLRDSFDHDRYYYVYEMKRGMKSRGEDFRKDFFVEFEDNKLIKVSGDFEVSEDFNTPLDS